MIKQEEKIQSSIERDKSRIEEKRKSLHSKELEKQILWRKERERMAEEDRKKKEAI